MLDTYSPAFYADLVNNPDAWNIKNSKYKILVDGVEITVSFKVNTLLQKVKDGFSSYLSWEDDNRFLYDPIQLKEYYDAGGECVLGELPELPINIVRHRVLMFAKILALMSSERVARMIAEKAIKKKDKTLFINRTMPVAVLFVANHKGKVLSLSAKSTKANMIELKATTFYSCVAYPEDDLLISTNLFKET